LERRTDHRNMGKRVADFRLGKCHNSGLEKEKP
jgi:hypothetical protein